MLFNFIPGFLDDMENDKPSVIVFASLTLKSLKLRIDLGDLHYLGTLRVLNLSYTYKRMVYG